LGLVALGLAVSRSLSSVGTRPAVSTSGVCSDSSIWILGMVSSWDSVAVVVVLSGRVTGT
jgi:hypothetical protein